MTDNEIIEALECCSCETLMYCEDQCPFYEKCMKDEQLSKYALDLINRQQAEIERLSTLAKLGNMRANDYRVMRDRALKAEAEIERLREIRDLCNTTILEKNEQIEKLETSDASKEEYTIRQHGEIKELKTEIERLKKSNEMFTDIGKMYSEIKADAVKEFAERFKQIAGIYQKDTYVIGVDEFDNLLKEMVGGK